MDAVAKTFKQLWRSTNGFKIRRLGDRKVLFVFDNLHDVDCIIKNQPWSFDKYLLVIQRYDSDYPTRNLIFNKVTFWVQVHDITFRYMIKQITECLCDIIGEVQKSSGVVDDEGGHIMRVRITLDLTLPLCQGRVITLKGGGNSWVSFKFERLPNLCYWCGWISHDDKNCELWIQSKGTLKIENQQFGLSLWAAPYTYAGNDVIYIPGYYEDHFSQQSKPPSDTVVGVVVEEVVATKTPMDQPDKESEQCVGDINAQSFSNSNSWYIWVNHAAKFGYSYYSGSE